MTEQTVDVRRPEPADRSAWRALYNGYAAFYRVPMTDEIAETVWSWLQDPGHDVCGYLAVAGGKVVGLAHFRPMPSPLRGVQVGFLDDLFVAPEARGQGVAEALFSALSEEGRLRGWPFIRWLTADDNYRARALYDRLARKTAWNTYQLDL